MSVKALGVCLTIASYLLIVRTFRYSRRRKLEKIYAHLLLPDGNIKPGVELNPVDAQKIVWFIGRYERPWALSKAIEFALFKTYGIPSIASLLCQTTELSNLSTAGKRAEDTSCLFQEFIDNPLDGERCRLAIARMNWMHSHYGNKISYEDIMFTWAATTVEPVEWFRRFEWSPATPLEKHGLFIFWREIGRRMGVPQAMEPSTYEELEEWYKSYDAKNTVYSKASNKLAEATINVMSRSIPIQSLHPTVKKVIIFSMGDQLRKAMGMEEVSPVIGKVVQAAFNIRGWIIRNLCLPRIRPNVRYTAYTTNSKGRYNKQKYTFEPYYVARTWSSVLGGWFLTGLVPSKEKYLSDGYIIEEDFGPESMKGKGVDIVRENAQKMATADNGVSYGCPFVF